MTNMLKQTVVVEGATANSSMSTERAAIKKADGTDYRTIPIAVTGTAIGTAAKTTTAAEPLANTLVAVKFTNGNSAASVTVAFAGGTARAVQIAGAAVLAAELTVAAGGVALFLFDGTILHQVGVQP